MIKTRSIGRERGEGERLASRTDRNSKIVKGLLFGVGVASGAAIGFHVASNDLDFGAQWPPVISAGIAVLYLLAIGLGSIALSRLTDEVERYRNYKAAALAGAVYLVLYPVWFLLWKGGFVVEPVHWVLFVTFWFSLAAGSIYYRFR